ncbi:MAG: EpsG family protein [Promethearchaeota archaeon]
MKAFQASYELLQKYKKELILAILICISLLCVIFLQELLFFIERIIVIPAEYYNIHGPIYPISLGILIISPIIYAFLYKFGFKITSFQFPEKIQLRYLLLLHTVVSFLALWRGGDKWVGSDLPTYFSMVNFIVQEFDLVIWSFFNNPRGLDRYLVGEPLGYFLLAAIVAIGLPIHFISVVSIIFSLINLSLTYKLLLQQFEETTASTGALIYIFSPVILKFEADLLRTLFAITFGLLALYFWKRKKVLTALFFALSLATHIVTACLFLISLLYLAKEERCLRKFTLIALLGFLISLLPIWLIIDPNLIYFVTIGRIQRYIDAGTFFNQSGRHPALYPLWTDALIIPSIRIVTYIGLFLVYFAFNYRDIWYRRYNISKPHWSIWVVVTASFIVLGYIFPYFRPERWALYLGFALMFLIIPSLKQEDKTLFLIFLIGCFVAFAAHIPVAY